MNKLQKLFLVVGKLIWNGRNRFSVFILFIAGILMNMVEFIGIYTNTPETYMMALVFYPVIIMPIILSIIIIFIILWVIETVFHLYLPAKIANTFSWKFIYILGIFNLIPLCIYLSIIIFSYIYSFILWVLIH